MTNIFENAKFGDKFRTRDGRMAIFSSHSLKGETATVHLLVNCYTPQSIRYYYNGVVRDSDNHNIDIVSEWQEPVNEEELDKLSHLFIPIELISHYDLPISKEQVGLLRDCFKAGWLSRSIRNKENTI